LDFQLEVTRLFFSLPTSKGFLLAGTAALLAQVVTDLTVDTPPDFPASSTAAGPTLAPEELAGRKLLALFDRAAVRDFATRM
jgi:hypothetical protein